MKLDLLSSIGVAIVGVVLGFMLTTIVVPTSGNYEVKTLDKTANGAAADNSYNYSDFKEPDVEVFNYDALNPTVEVFVGECEKYDENGACLQVTTVENEENSDEENPDQGSSDQENS